MDNKGITTAPLANTGELLVTAFGEMQRTRTQLWAPFDAQAYVEEYGLQQADIDQLGTNELAAIGRKTLKDVLDEDRIREERALAEEAVRIQLRGLKGGLFQVTSLDSTDPIEVIKYKRSILEDRGDFVTDSRVRAAVGVISALSCYPELNYEKLRLDFVSRFRHKPKAMSYMLVDVVDRQGDSLVKLEQIG